MKSLDTADPRGSDVHRLDLLRVALVDDLALDLHRRRELAALDRELERQDRPALDGLDPSQALVQLLDALLEVALPLLARGRAGRVFGRAADRLGDRREPL